MGRSKLKALDDDTVMNQTEQCLDWLSGRTEADPSRAGVTGFCMGGRYTFLANAQHVTFQRCRFVLWWRYRPEGRFRRPESTLDRIPEMQAPILLWYGSEDQSIQPDELGRIATAMAEGKREYRMTCFPNVGHGFFCEDRASYDAYAAETLL